MVTLNPAATPHAMAYWTVDDAKHSALWSLGNTGAPPKRIVLANDTLNADAAYRQISQGTSLLWQGDFQNAKQLLQAIARRMAKRATMGNPRKSTADTPHAATKLPDQRFNRYRQQQSQRAAMLNRLLIPLDANYTITLRRAPMYRQPASLRWVP